MWGSFLDKGRELAEKAKKAAEDLDKQLNESVGVPATLAHEADAKSSIIGSTTDISIEESDLNDEWGYDDDTPTSNKVPFENHESDTSPSTDDYPNVEKNVFETNQSTEDNPNLPSTGSVAAEDSNEAENDQSLTEEIELNETDNDQSLTEKTKLKNVVVNKALPDNAMNQAIQQGDATEELQEPVEQPEEPTEMHPSDFFPSIEENVIVPSVVASVSPNESDNVQSLMEKTASHDVASNRVVAIDAPIQAIQQHDATKELEKHVEELTRRLEQREKQLLSKNEELMELQAHHDKERNEFQLKLQSIKDEAKRRILQAKERAEAVERQMSTMASTQTGAAEVLAQKDEIIQALRTEGEKLAHKQAEIEKAVRSAKLEAREASNKLQEVQIENEDAFMRIQALESELAGVNEALLSARKAESQADKFEAELRSIKEESERKQATIISLEQQVKELKTQKKDLQVELESSKKGAAVESEQERKKLLKEHNEFVADLQNTIRITEREAAIREDALRREIEELRKRWQDAVRRADSLTIDIQSSTAPLLRQIDSISKQNRAQASAWTELEAQLRRDLEESVILNDRLSKERNELKSKSNRIERLHKDLEEDLKKAVKDLEEKNSRVVFLEEHIRTMEAESVKMKEQWTEVEKLANEGISRVRSEMMKTVFDSEERYRSQLESVKSELTIERDTRKQLEEEVERLLDKVGVLVPTQTPSQLLVPKEESKPKRLIQSEGQLSILASALTGIVDESDDENDDTDIVKNPQPHTNSFAALEQLTTSLKATKNELLVLQHRLSESERSREQLVDALAECRSAKDKLPHFELKVKELTEQNTQLTQEVEGLREDIADVRELYRAQLNALLEEKATWETTESQSNGKKEILDPIPSQEDNEMDISNN